MRQSLAVGIFVGGGSTRMGGSPKGLLRPRGDDGPTIVESLAAVAREIASEVALVGDVEAYDTALPGVRRVRDARPGEGPLAGLLAWLSFLGAQSGISWGVALACDTPFVTRRALEVLVHEAREQRDDIDAVVIRNDSRLEAFPACYRVRTARPIAEEIFGNGERSFQSLFSALTTREVTPDDWLRRAIVDWDAPEDIRRH